jgi:1-acyl-sn-glycerol-3-phosphate acyltransferase
MARHAHDLGTPDLGGRIAFNPLAVRVMRMVRLALHLCSGLWIVWRKRFAQLPLERRHFELQRWSAKVLDILQVTVVSRNQPTRLPQRCVIVLNHVSWLDIFAIFTLSPGVFVAKAEIARWPLIGRLVGAVGTLFLERGRYSDAKRANRLVAATIAGGEPVCLCPEGMTTLGRKLLPFHAALLQPAINASAVVQPVALRYVDALGRHTDAAGYVGDQSLLASIWLIVGQPSLRVEMDFAGIIPATLERRALARACERAIAAALGIAPPHKEPDRCADPRAAPPSVRRPRRIRYPATEDRPAA